MCDDDQTSLSFFTQPHPGRLRYNASGGNSAAPLEQDQRQKRPKRRHRRDLGIAYPAGKNRDELLAVLENGEFSRRVRQAIALRQSSLLDTNGRSHDSGSIERRTRNLSGLVPNRMQMFHDVVVTPERVYSLQKSTSRATNRMLR